MNVDTYRLLHITGLMLVFLGLGGVLLRPADGNPRIAMMLHGIGMLLLLVAGFAIHAKRNFGFDAWVFCKIGLWVLLGAVPVLVKKRIFSAHMGWIVAVACGVTAAYLGFHKSF